MKFFLLKIYRKILKKKKGLEQIFKYIGIFKNLQTNIQLYLRVQKSTNEYPNIFVLGKCHKYKYLNICAHHCNRDRGCFMCFTILCPFITLIVCLVIILFLPEVIIKGRIAKKSNALICIFIIL